MDFTEFAGPACRPGILTSYERTYPFAWLGILAEAPPSSEELVYCYHDRGFALLSMRSPKLSRLYLQCAPDEVIENWPDERIWEELHTRLAREGWTLTRRPNRSKRHCWHEKLCRRTDAIRATFSGRRRGAHCSPDGRERPESCCRRRSRVGQALAEFYRSGSRALLDRYSETCLRRVWKVQRFSWWMTSMLHRFDSDNAFDQRRQLGELDYVTSSRAASQSLAENYVGLPME